jgi:hypothetical protein
MRNVSCGASLTLTTASGEINDRKRLINVMAWGFMTDASGTISSCQTCSPKTRR